MPIKINEVEAEVDVESGSAPARQGVAGNESEALQRWREWQRREQQIEARTAAHDFDD